MISEKELVVGRLPAGMSLQRAGVCTECRKTALEEPEVKEDVSFTS